MSSDFEGGVAVVTGGSEGLGQDFCRQLAQGGCDVWFCARDGSRGRAAAERMGPRAHFVQADVADPAQVDMFAHAVRHAAGRVDYLVNNVAVDDRIPIGDATPEQCDRLWQVNLRSYLLVTRAFLDLLRAGDGKSIVNVGTTNYMLGLVPMTVYNATKSGIVGYTRSLARELGPEGIRANMVTPGWIMTEKQLHHYASEDDKRQLLNDQCLKLLLYPEHVTPAVLFLLSPASRAITGQELVVDAGKVMG